jgi:hypothetical protein
MPKMNSKVIDLTLIRSETVIGHIFGGIVADAGNGGNTGPSGRVFEVMLRPLAGGSRLAISHSDQEVNLTWPGSEGWSYLLETSKDLAAWEERGIPVTGQAAPILRQEPITDSRRFYRLLEGRYSRPPAP